MQNKLEKMAEFFDSRLNEYDNHQLTCIESATKFYDFSAKQLPKGDVKVLDLGCGTGLELEYYFKLNPKANIVGIDIANGMLNSLKNKFKDKDIRLILGSYFDVEFEIDYYDAVISVESLHHFTKEMKVNLYEKVLKCLKKDGYFILTDYFSLSNEEELMHKKNLEELKKQQNINDNEFYHYDTPLTVEHETQALKEAGFNHVIVLNNWGQTYTIKAYN